LQTIPKTITIKDLDISVRSAFCCSRPGRILLAADYSQIEMRVLAHVCGDPALLGLFDRHGDVYARLAAQIMHKQVGEVAEEERNRAKVVCLGLIYGMGVPQVSATPFFGVSKCCASDPDVADFDDTSGLHTATQVAKKLRLSVQEAQTLVNNFMRAFPRIGEFIEKTKRYVVPLCCRLEAVYGGFTFRSRLRVLCPGSRDSSASCAR
jgi:DNA polymerase I-like protein with 3'-5' exonuclease and polymerase domains